MTLSMLSVVFGRGARLAAAAMMTLALLGFGAGPAAAVTPGATIQVNSTSDAVSPTDGLCTLREAIFAANTNTASGSAAKECAAGTTKLDTINFDTSVSAFHSNADILISNSTDQISLPAITAPVVITNNTGHAVFVQGWGGSSTGEGFTFDTGSAGSVLDGMLIGDWGGVGVWLKGSSGKVTLTDNWIGVYWNGTTAVGSNNGVIIQSSNNVIGGLNGSGHARTNVISGNDYGIYVKGGAHNIIQGNYIGTAANGLSALGNSDAGIVVEGGVGNQVGGTLPHQGNVISGNTNDGMFISAFAQATIVQRNFFGVGADGVTPVWNNNADIEDYGGLGTVIGGTIPQASNVIAGATDGIILVSYAATITITGNLIGLDAHGGAAGNDNNGIRFAGSPAKTTITGNLISNNTRGINFQSNTPVVSVTQNCITGNANHGVVTLGGTESVAGNWWGVGTGPNTPGGDTTSGSLTVTPWLTVPPSSCLGWAPKTISPKDQSFKNVSTKATKFSWGAVSTADDYHFTLSQNADLSFPIDDNLDTGLHAYHSDGPLAGGMYYWQTITNTADGFEWKSPIHTLTIGR